MYKEENSDTNDSKDLPFKTAFVTVKK